MTTPKIEVAGQYNMVLEWKYGNSELRNSSVTSCRQSLACFLWNLKGPLTCHTSLGGTFGEAIFPTTLCINSIVTPLIPSEYLNLFNLFATIKL